MAEEDERVFFVRLEELDVLVHFVLLAHGINTLGGALRVGERGCKRGRGAFCDGAWA